jgi:hypothetical protein
MILWANLMPSTCLVQVQHLVQLPFLLILLLLLQLLLLMAARSTPRRLASRGRTNADVLAEAW